jgi:hypothetical protein
VLLVAAGGFVAVWAAIGDVAKKSAAINASFMPKPL